jgi:hypothetical protein
VAEGATAAFFVCVLYGVVVAVVLLLIWFGVVTATTMVETIHGARRLIRSK